MLYGQTLKTPRGIITVSNQPSRKDAVEFIVRLARRDGAKPRVYFWQFWRDEWPEDCVQEYLRQERKDD